MSTATAQTASACAGQPSSLSCIGCALRDACRRFWLVERTRAELAALSDVELKDIGLSRCDINRVAVENYR
jgi:uncharacterized protein YjiS (DUF1127 family)